MTSARDLCKNAVVKNSFWGITSHISQAVLVSLFFVIVARKYSVQEFADYAISMSFYQLVASFSSLGLGQWLIRELAAAPDQEELVNRFLKIEICSGAGFYLVNSLAAFYTYDHYLGLLTMILGVNIVFDNAIYGIKSLNIAQFQQVKTFIIVTVEAFLKFGAGCVVLFHHLSLVSLTILLVAIRFATLNLFMKVGSSSQITISSIMRCTVRAVDVKTLVLRNWPFIIIGSASITYWRIANLIISKKLAAADVASYEISYKVFSLAQMLPVIVSASTFPILARLFSTGDREELRVFYRKMYAYYFVFGLISYIFIYSFADALVPLVFGSAYATTPVYTKQMFCTMLVFPTAYLQANALVAMELEKYDMWLNVVALACNVVISLVALSFVRSLSVVNYAIFASLLVFHLLQNTILIRHGMCTIGQAAGFYLATAAFAAGYSALSAAFRELNALVPFSAVTFCCLFWAFIDSSRRGQPSHSS